jgi:ribosome recycling factor
MCVEELDDDLSNIKSGRASTRIFDDLQVKAYGEMADF